MSSSSLLTTSAAGALLALKKSEMDNVFGSVLTFYLVATAWVTARRKDGETGFFDWMGFLAITAIAAFAVTYWIEAAFSQTGTKAGIRAGRYVLPAVVALIAATGDVRMLLVRGPSRRVENRAASLAHVLCIVCRFRIHLSGAPTAIPRFSEQVTRALGARHFVAGVDGLLAGPRPVYECFQENKPVLSNPERRSRLNKINDVVAHTSSRFWSSKTKFHVVSSDF